MGNFFIAFFEGGLGMYPILVTGIIMIIASIRYAIDTEPVRLRFIKYLSLVLLAMMFFWGVIGVVSTFTAMAIESETARQIAIAKGITCIINTTGLSMLVFVLTYITVSVGVYRAGHRELKALKP